MVNQVMVVSILMIIQGALTLIMALLCAFYAVFVPVMMSQSPGGPPNKEVFFGVMVAVYAAMGLSALVCSVLNIWGGIRGLAFRSRGLVLAGVFANVLALPTCYCIPTGLTVLIYGAIVMFNSDVARAFELGQQGMSAEKIRNRLDPARRMTGYYDEDDDD